MTRALPRFRAQQAHDQTLRLAETVSRPFGPPARRSRRHVPWQLRNSVLPELFLCPERLGDILSTDYTDLTYRRNESSSPQNRAVWGGVMAEALREANTLK